ncbi:MAG TPA: class I SAM-dependent methyltransferase, partial [Candidatus Dormibacteraeota bacterium]|nr:class I SAM-dependent methyltransferase [Candidatus Dormibacteraeota bacterium]
GGEPLLRRDLLRLVAVIRAAGCVPGLVTTGRPLVYPQWRERLRRAGLEYLRMQFFGVGAAHDHATALPGGFAQALAGLRDWVAEAGGACDVDVGLSTRTRPLDDLAAEVETLAGALSGSTAQIVVAVDPDRPPDPALRAAAQALAGWNDDAARPLLVWEGLIDAPPSASFVGVAPPRPAFLGPEPSACCLGSLDALSRAAAPPVEETRANSFNYVRSGRSVAWTAGAADCEAHRAGSDLDPRRQLWLVDGERLVHYATDTGDFPLDEIARTKDVWSHLFLDRAPAGVLDDIGEGMRRVLPDPTCDPCPHRAGCGRRVRIVDEPPFARQEAWIRGHVAALRGRVLDVGCGEQPYHDILRPLVRAGALEYTGLDPDPPSLERARAALPEGRFLQSGIEEFRSEAGGYDHLLSLRSLNHVFDLDLALARMAELLRPGGSLLLVECTPFAMLREPAQVAAADRAPRAGHQHFRNVASEQVLPLARRRSLVVREHSPSSLATTNQWILLLERR